MYLRVLGGLALDGTGFQRRKPLLLLAYLVLEGSTSRRDLAELFWTDARDPRDSLSTAVRRLSADGRSCLVLEGDRLASAVGCDAVAFEAAVREGDPAAALGRYGGAFLAGLDLPLSLELEEWVFATRERLAHHVRQAHLRVARDHLRAGDATTAARHAEDALDVRHAPTWEAGGLADLARLLRACGSARLGELEREAVELGLPLRGPARHEDRGSEERRVRLPYVATSFVGRTRERERIASILAGADVRLLTLHGPGGVGKSRLALEAAHATVASHGAIGDAVFVPVEEVRDPHLLPAAIADALDVHLAPLVPEERQIVSILGERPLLLLLDNLEHLAHDTRLIAEILGGCPNVRLLVTSRQRLHLPEEHVLPVEGLPTDGGGDGSDAMRLLVDRVGQVDPDRPSSPEDELAAGEICRLVHGNPLALELAAAWARLLSLPGIAQELRQDLDLLESAAARAPARHKSLRTTFEISWRLLDRTEQAVLRRAAVFRAGFRREAAREVLDADLRTLASLADKALLRVTSGGRFERHPLVHQYTREKLAEDPDEERESRTRHARYFLATAARLGDAGMGGPDVKSAWAWFGEEFANLASAWRFAADDASTFAGLLSDVGWSLAHYGEQCGRFRDVRELLRSAVRGRGGRLEGEALALCAWQSMRLGELDTATVEAARGLDLLDPLDRHEAFRGRWSAFEALMGVDLTSGRFDEGLRHARRAIRCAREEIDRHPPDDHPKDAEIALGLSYTALGWAQTFCGRHDEAAPAIATAHELTKRHDSGGLVFALSLKGQHELYSGDPDAALSTLHEGLALARRVGFETQEAQILCDLAHAQHALGDLDAAEASCRSGLAITQRNGNRWHETLLHSALGRVLLADGRAEAALAAFTAAARSGLAGGVAAYAAEALIGLAEHHARSGRAGEAAALLSSVLSDPTAPASAKGLAAAVADLVGVESSAPPQPMIAQLQRLARRRARPSRR